MDAFTNMMINTYLQFIQTEEGKKMWLNAHLMIWDVKDTINVMINASYYPAPPSVAEIWNR